MVTLAPLVYFAAFAAATLYLNVILWATAAGLPGRKRRWMRAHVLAARALALAAMVASLTLLASNARASRLDATSEQIHSLSPETKALLRTIDRAAAGVDPGLFQSGCAAQLRGSPQRPGGHAARISGGRRTAACNARIIETVKYSPQAREAQERFGIKPFRVPATRRERPRR